MTSPPRSPAAPFLDRDMRLGILGGGALLATSVLVSAWLGVQFGGDSVGPIYRTSAFTAWMLGHVVLAHRFRTWRASLRQVGWFSNRVLNLWSGAAVLTVVLVSYLPGAQRTLGTAPLPVGMWIAIIVATLVLIGGGARWVRAGT